MIRHMVDKLYYSIGEVSRMFNVNPSLIRYWEKEFDVINPRKNKKGNRLFTSEDIDHFRLIYHLVKERGFTLKGAREQIRLRKNETLKQIEILRTLQRLREFLLKMKEGLKAV
ncbi:MAG: MerR family transcriptional regulator [Bacteroidales bacterium]|nr:MerR family transcriptional regulator [Bacteroidales bacterium]